MASKTVRAPMARSRRAKQFQPFDALHGLKEAIAAKERIPTPRRHLSEESIAEIDKALNSLQKGQIVTVVYYGVYEQEYLQLTGPVMKVDPYWHSLAFYISERMDNLHSFMRSGSIVHTTPTGQTVPYEFTEEQIENAEKLWCSAVAEYMSFDKED